MGYKLYYFNARGHAEIIRLIFAAAGEKYEDIRLTAEQWDDFRNNKAKGTAALPLLQLEGGNFIPETKVIARHLGREFGLYGDNNHEKVVVDLTIEIIRQLSETGFRFKREKDAAKKEEYKKEFESSLATRMAVLEGMLKRRNGGDGHMLGNKISIGDIAFFVFVEHFASTLPDLLTDYPKLKALEERVRSHEGIADWLAKRPADDFEGCDY